MNTAKKSSEKSKKSSNLGNPKKPTANQRAAMSISEEIDRALLQALACREDRKRGEQTLESLRRKENDSIERLQELVRTQRALNDTA